MNINKALQTLKREDIYSFMMFALYELRNVEEYRVLSELSYILDNENILNFLDYYGGMTLKVPKKEDLRLVINALLLYQYVNLEGIEVDKALKKLKKSVAETNKIRKCYETIALTLEKYSFNRD